MDLLMSIQSALGFLIEQRQPLHTEPEQTSVPVKSCFEDLSAKNLQLITDLLQDVNFTYKILQRNKWHHSKLETQVYLNSLGLKCLPQLNSHFREKITARKRQIR